MVDSRQKVKDMNNIKNNKYIVCEIETRYVNSNPEQYIYIPGIYNSYEEAIGSAIVRYCQIINESDYDSEYAKGINFRITETDESCTNIYHKNRIIAYVVKVPAAE